MKRRLFLRQLGSGALVAGAALGAGCKPEKTAEQAAGGGVGKSFKPVKWKMVTTSPT